MRSILTVLLLTLSAHSAMAQQYYAEQTYPAPQTQAPQQLSGNYVGQPYYVPATPQVHQQPTHVVPQPAPAQNSPALTLERSVTTDIRQMNF